MKSTIKEVVDSLEYYESVRGNPIALNRKPWLPDERAQLHNSLREYLIVDGQLDMFGRSGKFGKEYNELRKSKRKLLEAIALMVFDHDDIAVGVLLEDGRKLQVRRDRKNRDTLSIAIVPASIPLEGASLC